MKKVKKKVSTLALTVFLFTIPLVYAGTIVWSNEMIFTLSPGLAWTNNHTSQVTKASNETTWGVFHVTRTMDSRPSVRMVNSSSGTVRSNNITVPNNDRTFADSSRGGNLANVGESLRLQARAAINQVTFNQSLRVSFSAR